MACRRGAGAQARIHSQFPEEQQSRSPCPQPHKVRLSFQEQLTPQETRARTLSAASLGSVPGANRSNSPEPQNGYFVMCPKDGILCSQENGRTPSLGNHMEASYTHDTRKRNQQGNTRWCIIPFLYIVKLARINYSVSR